MKAFHNDKKIKAKYLRRVQAHRRADEIIRGTYWVNGKGCAVGCTVHSSQHFSYETELGIPQWLAKVEDILFEGMYNERAKTWPEEFLKAIPVGEDLDKVRVPFIVFVLESSIQSMRLAEFDKEKNPQVCMMQDKAESAVKEVIRCYKEELDFSAAWSAAWRAGSAAWSAARSAAGSAAWSAAWSAAESAAWSAAWSAAGSAAWSAAWRAGSAAWSAEYEKFADKLLDLFKSLNNKGKK